MAAIDFQTLRSQVSIAQVLELLGFVPICSAGGQVRGVCPIHGPGAPGSAEGRSFSVNLPKNAYRCFKCGSAGNQLDLWSAATGKPLHPAAIELCETLHISVPWMHHGLAASRQIQPKGTTEKRNP